MLAKNCASDHKLISLKILIENDRLTRLWIEYIYIGGQAPTKERRRNIKNNWPSIPDRQASSNATPSTIVSQGCSIIFPFYKRYKPFRMLSGRTRGTGFSSRQIQRRGFRKEITLMHTRLKRFDFIEINTWGISTPHLISF